MAEVTSNAYDLIKYHIQSNWNRVRIYDNNGKQIVTYLTSHPNVNWIHPTKQFMVDRDNFNNPINVDIADGNVMQLEIKIKGEDISNKLPVTFAKSVIEQDKTGHVLSEEEFAPFEMTQDEDEITIIHNIQVPKID